MIECYLSDIDGLRAAEVLVRPRGGMANDVKVACRFAGQSRVMKQIGSKQREPNRVSFRKELSVVAVTGVGAGGPTIIAQLLGNH